MHEDRDDRLHLRPILRYDTTIRWDIKL